MKNCFQLGIVKYIDDSTVLKLFPIKFIRYEKKNAQSNFYAVEML